jgi:Fe-S cluster assembly protein SufD
MAVMNTLREAAPYLEAFQGYEGIPGQPAWLCMRREAAMRRFAELGFPQRNQEQWRFSDLRPLTAKPLLPIASPAASPHPAMLSAARLTGDAHRIVLVNGRFAAHLSSIGTLPPGVRLGGTAEAVTGWPDLVAAVFDGAESVGAQPLACLNAGFFTDGFFLALDAGAVLEKPIEIIHVSGPDRGAAVAGACHLRSAVIAGAFSQATIIESSIGQGAGWINAVTAIDIAEGAILRHAKIEADSTDAVHTSQIRATLATAARYESFTLTTGARMSRQDVHVVLTGEGAALGIKGAYLLRGEQEATFAPCVEHRAHGCETNEVLKGVMQDRAHGVFLGTIMVHPGADQTNARQLNRNLLLSPAAWVDTKPELEILADDVKCSHGATIGSLDESALFYLLSRGIDEATARDMLIEAFAADVIDIADFSDAIKDHLRAHLQRWRQSAAGAA